MDAPVKALNTEKAKALQAALSQIGGVLGAGQGYFLAPKFPLNLLAELQQVEAAKRLGTTQPRVSALLKGTWKDFSMDMLLTLATRAGLKPELHLAASEKRRAA